MVKNTEQPSYHHGLKLGFSGVRTVAPTSPFEAAFETILDGGAGAAEPSETSGRPTLAQALTRA